jgi:ATP-dependent Lon protease
MAEIQTKAQGMGEILQTEQIEIPQVIPILTVNNFVLFPFMIAPLVIADEKNKKLVDEVAIGQRVLGVVTRKVPGEAPPTFADLYDYGTAAIVLRMLKMPDGTVRVLIHGIERVRIAEPLSSEPYLKARIELVKEESVVDKEVEAMILNARALLQKAVSLSSLPDDLNVAAVNISDAGKLADLIASNLSLKVPEQQELLELANTKLRLQRTLYYLNREVEMMELGSKIQSQMKTEIDKSQREYLLREQLKAIKKELGEEEGAGAEIRELKGKIEATKMPDHARDVALKEVARLEMMHPSSAEYTVSRTYLDWILSLPWMVSTEDNIDISRAQITLDEDHYDLEKVKQRILEYLAVIKLRGELKGPILCFVGPPGVGKTSLGRSIARALGRKFQRMSLGGMRDEAEIRGHRRTYIGALPGRIIKAIKDSGANNPVIMLDEVDKLGMDFRGDPASALLEVLDPEQNFSFTDHYLDMPFDLSKVMFITTANLLDPIPVALRDRMEVLQLSGYAPKEKLVIAKKYLVPRELNNTGLTKEHIRFSDKAIMKIIEDYTREAGLRNLQREIGNVCRKVARSRAEGKTEKVHVSAKSIHEFLGPPRYFSEFAQRMHDPGVAIGLAWTPTGGEILFIEASSTKGKGQLILTGQLGDVMKESAQAARTYLHANAEKLGIPEEAFSEHDIHIHIPAGAIPKDGPSAGITLCAAAASLLLRKPLKDFVAMTGEITLKGNVLPVGGIKEKLLAAHRAGIKEVILPLRNKKDLEDIPADVRRHMAFDFVQNMGEVLQKVFA